MRGRLAEAVAAVVVAAMLAATLAATLGACGQEASDKASDKASDNTSDNTSDKASMGTLPSKAVETEPTLRASPTPVKSPPPPGFADLSDVDPTILQDIRYYTAHNFVGRSITGYNAPRCLLTTKAADALRQAQQAAIAKGLRLKVYDCYRPRDAVEQFKSWATTTPSDQEMKAEFYPSLSKGELLSKGWIAAGTSRHSRGSTVDLTLVAFPPATQRPYVPGEPLVACTEPADRRFPDNSIDMGTGFDCFDTKSHTEDPRVQGQPKQNRQTLKRLMEDAGFVNYENEWWHYRLANEPPGSDFQTFPINP